MIQLTQKEFETLTTFIKSKYGIDLSKKKILIEGRLSNMLVSRGISSFDEYMKILFNDRSQTEITNLLNRLTTNYTYFMREQEHFDYMTAQVLPYLTKTKTNREMRIWSAACSSGEEPYSLAMTIDDFLGPQKPKWDTRILSTDISVNVLEKAKAGIYSQDSVASLPDKWVKKHFTDLKNGTCQISQKMRDEMIFNQFNLMDEFKFKQPFDLIVCRNVMIYFDAPTKDKLIEKFYKVTAPGGFLFIGHSETVNKQTSKYNYIKPAIYRKGFDAK